MLWEPEAGYAFARRACEHVSSRLVAEGGHVRQRGRPDAGDCGRTQQANPHNSRRDLTRDAFVFACGPWLPAIFPDVLAGKVDADAPGGLLLRRCRPAIHVGSIPRCPSGSTTAERLIYGIPGDANRGFKVADDTPGPRIDPTTRRAGCESGRHCGGARVPDATVSRARRGAAPRIRGVPVPRRRPTRTSSSTAIRGGERLDCRRRIGPRIQDGPGVGEMVASLVLAGGSPIRSSRWRGSARRRGSATRSGPDARRSIISARPAGRYAIDRRTDAEERRHHDAGGRPGGTRCRPAARAEPGAAATAAPGDAPGRARRPRRQDRVEVAGPAEEKISQTSHTMRLDGREHQVHGHRRHAADPRRRRQGRGAHVLRRVHEGRRGSEDAAGLVPVQRRPRRRDDLAAHGSFGPKRVEMADDGFQPAPPYHLVDNEDSLLESPTWCSSTRSRPATAAPSPA